MDMVQLNTELMRYETLSYLSAPEIVGCCRWRSVTLYVVSKWMNSSYKSASHHQNHHWLHQHHDLNMNSIISGN